MATAAINAFPGFAIPELLGETQSASGVGKEKSVSRLGTGLKVMIVDDSAVSRKVVENTLFGEPYSLIFASTGSQAVNLFEEYKPALVIMDWMMPDLSGLEICQRIRAMSQGYTYIIMLTAKTEKASVVEGLQAGADDYLTKPFHEAELIARIGVGLRTLELHRQLEARNNALEKMAMTDSLTGLPNRRAIEEHAKHELSGAARHGFSVWAIMADLDRFKYINDTFGHKAGDEVLAKFSKILKAHTRRSDISGRLGGEEFLMMVTHATAGDAQKLTERIRAELEATSFTFSGCNVMVTASFGVAGFEGKEAVPSFNEICSLADATLYSAKRGGRNRVEIAANNLP
jgi:two-component system, cell cycle response regulator